MFTSGSLQTSKGVRATLDRLESGRDVLRSPDFERGDFEAERAGRFLNLQHVQHGDRTAHIGHDRQPAKSGENLTQEFEALQGRSDTLYVCSDPLGNTNRIHIGALALGARLPTMYVAREFVEAGGLMSYGPNYPVLFRRAAEFVDKILRGTKPADIPVEQPTKFELVINLKTAKALSLAVPPTMLARADEVIE